MKGKKKIFVLVASSILLLVAAIPAVNAAVIKATIENNPIVNEILTITSKNNDKKISKGTCPLPTDIGNDGFTRNQKRLGWKYTLKEYRRDFVYAVIVAPLWALAFTADGMAAILAVIALLDYLSNGGDDPATIVALLSTAIAALLVAIDEVHNQTVRKKFQAVIDALNALLTWMDENQDYKEDMIIEGWIFGCKLNEEITVHCRGVDATYNSGLNRIVKYSMVVPSDWGGEQVNKMHTCLIDVQGSKHLVDLNNGINDRWCYSDGILDNHFRFL